VMEEAAERTRRLQEEADIRQNQQIAVAEAKQGIKDYSEMESYLGVGGMPAGGGRGGRGAKSPGDEMSRRINLFLSNSPSAKYNQTNEANELRKERGLLAQAYSTMEPQQALSAYRQHRAKLNSSLFSHPDTSFEEEKPAFSHIANAFMAARGGQASPEQQQLIQDSPFSFNPSSGVLSGFNQDGKPFDMKIGPAMVRMGENTYYEGEIFKPDGMDDYFQVKDNGDVSPLTKSSTRGKREETEHGLSDSAVNKMVNQIRDDIAQDAKKKTIPPGEFERRFREQYRDALARKQATDDIREEEENRVASIDSLTDEIEKRSADSVRVTQGAQKASDMLASGATMPPQMRLALMGMIKKADARLKENEQVIENASEMRRRLEGVGGADARTGELGVLDNPDGTVSTEKSITVEVAELNGGKPTNIPLLVDGQVNVEAIQRGDPPTREQVDIAVRRAISRVRDGASLPSFDSVGSAEIAAQQRSDEKSKAMSIEDKAEQVKAQMQDLMKSGGTMTAAQYNEYKRLKEIYKRLKSGEDVEIEPPPAPRRGTRLGAYGNL